MLTDLGIECQRKPKQRSERSVLYSFDSRIAIIVRMKMARLLSTARRRAGLTQRELARRAGVPHSTVARIELGRLSPRTDTLEALLRATGHALAVETALGEGVDRSQIRALLTLTPLERTRLAADDAANFDALAVARRP